MSICLVMIVKDESSVIGRCLRSALPFIDSWSIVDTGSTDNTKEIIREVMKDLPGELHERPWKNFAHNRTEMIHLARGKADYDLMIDADDVIEASDDFTMPELTHDKYDLTVIYSGIMMQRPHVFRNDAGFRYESVLHEYLHNDGAHTSGTIHGLVYRVIGGGDRGKDPVGKYKRDAETLRMEIVKDPSSHLASRYTFYLAQSYKDTATCLVEAQAPQSEVTKFMKKALKAYDRRARMEGFYEETFVSLVESAKLHTYLGSGERLICDTFMKAYEALHTRGAEPLYYLARYYRLKNRFALAYLYANTGASIGMPQGLFVEHEIYKWRIYDELALAAYYTGRFTESHEINKDLLEYGDLPDHERPRIKNALQFCKDRIGDP